AQNGPPPPPCYANGNVGAGGVVGTGHYFSGYNGSMINFSFKLGTDMAGVEFNDVLVLYLATGHPGRSVIDNTVDDSADGYRIAITNSNVNGFGSTITFPVDFEATHAIAIDSNSGGLYTIPNNGPIGNGDLVFVNSVNSTLVSNTQEIFEISFDAADIGLSANDPFMLVGVYVSHTGFTYDEGYGDGIASNTQGSDDISFSGIPNQSACWNTLSIDALENSTIRANYYNNALHINGLYDTVEIKSFDLLGRKLFSENHEIYGQKSIPMPLKKNQFQFIVIENSVMKKVIKVIPRSN
ncbi:MAG: hypothetical protein HKN54_11035, partial [Flavobacteriaceae bacterium]|nr:hypothetical protein [Flavobacteriaceae bacterium]